jgi:hypothetical protein
LSGPKFDLLAEDASQLLAPALRIARQHPVESLRHVEVATAQVRHQKRRCRTLHGPVLFERRQLRFRRLQPLSERGDPRNAPDAMASVKFAISF